MLRFCFVVCFAFLNLEFFFGWKQSTKIILLLFSSCPRFLQAKLNSLRFSHSFFLLLTFTRVRLFHSRSLSLSLCITVTLFWMRASANTSETCNNDGVSNKTTAFVRKTCFVLHESSNRTHGFRAAAAEC